jgi:hypothetical protein
MSAAEVLRECDLAQISLDLVRREEEFLDRLQVGLRQLNAALGGSAIPEQTAALKLQEELADGAAAMRQERLRWRIEVGRLLRMPAERVTLAVVAEALGGPAGTALRAGRERLRQRVQEAGRLHLSGAVLVRTYLHFLQRFFQDLTRSGAASGRYDRAGASTPPPYGSFLKAQG